MSLVAPGAILERDVVRSDQTIPAVTNFRASPQVDSIERQSVGGLVGGSVGDRQLELARRRDVGLLADPQRCATEVDVELGCRPTGALAARRRQS